MNLSQFFAHWKIAENPFRGEEARRDAVFTRMGAGDTPPSEHSDFEKIMGDIGRPSTSIVFGEKGSGKTAIRLQISSHIAQHNRAHPDNKTLLIAYDEFNGLLDHFHARHTQHGRKGDPSKTLAKLRLVDHLDALISIGTGRLIDGLIGGANGAGGLDLGEQPLKAARAMPPALKTDLLLLASAYDTADFDGRRLGALRRKLRKAPPRGSLLAWGVSVLGWLPAVALYGWMRFFTPGWASELFVRTAMWAALGLLALWLIALIYTFVWQRLTLRQRGARMARATPMLARTPDAYAAALTHLDPPLRSAAYLPMTGSEEQRYAMLDRLRRIVARFGYTGLLVVIDRVDEPTLINGDADRMRAVVWPMLNNKFLQQDGLGVKMLLPAELRHALFKESNAFFQEARLDKQNLVERLSWTGPMLHDVCSARLAACMEPGTEAVSLLDLFADDVTRQDLVDALDQMHQPRDAFKFLYRVLTEHCSNVTTGDDAWQVPRHVLESVRKSEAERVGQLERGIRPA